MRARGWSRLAVAATTTYYAQCALLLLLLPTAPTAAGTPPILPTQDSSAYISRGNQILPTEDSSSSSDDSTSGRLAVVVPAWRGDVDRALAAVGRWPTVCSAVTLSKVELVLYMAEGEEESPAALLLPTLEGTAGRCFAQTKVVYAHLREQDNFYPKGPSVQFYKIFLDEDVRAHFSEYDAVSIIEWDVTVAHDTSFERLYHAAFGGLDPFWVKGSVLAGGSFHRTASDSNMWHVLGHINGNAIYNNNDPAWFEYVEYTLTRWDYRYAYDVALWATISDFPYSWPLWQHYSSKFVTTNLIANVAFENVDAGTVNTAIAGDTLFIHGRSIEGGSASHLARRKLRAEPPQSDIWCEPSCGDAGAITAGELPAGMSTACDASCGVGGRFGGYLCGAGDSRKFGGNCRLCYTNQKKALRAEEELRGSGEFSEEGGEARHVIMCDTMRPPAAMACSPECARKKDTVCDSTCGSGRHGDYNCGWRGHGWTCRYCFEHVKTALLADEVAVRRGGRVIMCDTHEPPREEPVQGSNASVFVADEARKLAIGKKGIDKKNKEWAKKKGWNTVGGQRRKGKGDDGKRRLDDRGCQPGCASSEGAIRVCDPGCSDDGDLHDTRGCGDDTFGENCWTCYTNMADAKEAESFGNEAVMCVTLEYASADGSFSQAGSDRQQHGRWLSDARSANTGCEAGCTSSEGVIRVCDSVCSDDDPLHDTQGCGDDTFGENCRTCYTSMAAAKDAEYFGDEAIMCDTLEYASADGSFGQAGPNRQQHGQWLPDVRSTASGCDSECRSGQGVIRVCDSVCSDDDPLHDTQGCGDDTFGENCRTCYTDMAAAKDAESAGNEAIMCDTLEYASADGSFGRAGSDRQQNRRRLSDVHRRSANSGCDSDCESTETVTTGNVCDPDCSDPDSTSPYGTLGCGDSGLGVNCRACYYVPPAARRDDSSDYNIVMCDDLAPLGAYARGQPGATEEVLVQLSPDASRPVFPSSKGSSSGGGEEFGEFSTMTFASGLVRGDLCAFVSSSAEVIGETDATVRSVLTFMPGVRIAIAVSEKDFRLFRRAFGHLPGVAVSSSSNAKLSALVADKHCGNGSELIYYMEAGSLLSRSFTSKDTHSPRGELLVAYSDGRGADYASRASSRASSILLGFESPLFTFGTDLILPSSINNGLRELLLIDDEGVTTTTSFMWGDDDLALRRLAEVDHVSAPEVLAAWAYSLNPEGLWFVNPQQWVSQHLFQAVSIWNIPLVKPTFSCSVGPSLTLADYHLSVELMRHLDALGAGATCESGFVVVDPQSLVRKTPLL